MSADYVLNIAAGAMLGSKYRVEKMLGQGGMGAVYLAENIDIGRKVAIKILHADFANDPNVLARFRMEARATAAIGHPGIVDVLDLGTTAEGAEFIVMERLEGETLGNRIKRRGSLPADELVPLVCDVLDALAAAHEKKIVHRDLKPENIFLCERPVKATKILDFGISKFSGVEDVSLTRTGTVMGSPLYMSPEQARGAKDIGPSTDLYSIGAILYEALAGVPPFNGSTYNEVIASVLMDEHRSLLELKPEVPAALSSVVDSLLAKTPADRPADARAARMDLRRALSPGATDIDVPTVQHSSPSPSSHRPAAGSAQRASIPPEAATRPAPDLPTAVVAAQRKTAATVIGLGAAVVVAAAGFAIYRRSTQPPAMERQPQVAIAAPVPAPPPAPAPAPPSKVELILKAEPASATWKLDGEELHCNPCTLMRDQGSQHVAIASAPGYSDGRLELVFDKQREEKLPLAQLKTASTASKDHSKINKSSPPPHAPDPVVKPVTAPPPKPDTSLNIDKSNPFR